MFKPNKLLKVDINYLYRTCCDGGNWYRRKLFYAAVYGRCCKWSRYECSKSNGNSVDVASRIIFFPVDACMRNLWIEWKIL